MDKQLKILVSGFKNALDVNPRPVDLLKWLEGSQRLNKLVDAIRAEPDKDGRSQLKKKLPAITPSGIFSVRRADGLIKHSGFIALDLDNLSDPQKGKLTLEGIANVFYAGVSASGRGLWCLVPLETPEHHPQHFDALKADFEALGLQVDKACRDVSRLRFYSYDLDPVFNPEAVPYRKLAARPTYNNPRHATNDNSPLDLLIQKIEATGTDLTGDYTDWLKIGSALASIYGEAGRDRFHRISQFYPEYSPQETERQFNACLRSKTDLGAAVIFSIAKNHNLYLKDNTRPTPRQARAPSREVPGSRVRQ